jgi:selenocysteine lyase/cysteine desulfurase
MTTSTAELLTMTERSRQDLFEIPEVVTYLNCANMSPQLRSVTQAGLEAVRGKASPWTVRAEDWFAPTERLRALFARIINGDPEGVAIVPSVSYGIALAAANVPVARGQSIVLLDGEFPSNVYVWHDLARRSDAVVRMIPRPSDGAWTEPLLQAIDSTTAVISVPNCHWTDGRLVDLELVAAAARHAGAALVIDGSQSVGAYPLDVAAMQPDFLVTVGYKWLLGPYGLAYLYAAARWRTSGVPLEHSWLTRGGAEDFSSLSEYSASYRPGARRFDMGEFPQFVLTPMATAALQQVLAWDVKWIQDEISKLTSRAENGAVEIGAIPVAGADRVGHVIGIRPRGGVRGELVSALAAANVCVSVRGDAIRVAPHVFNTEGDIDRLVDTIRQHS